MKFFVVNSYNNKKWDLTSTLHTFFYIAGLLSICDYNDLHLHSSRFQRYVCSGQGSQQIYPGENKSFHIRNSQGGGGEPVPQGACPPNYYKICGTAIYIFKLSATMHGSYRIDL